MENSINFFFLFETVPKGLKYVLKDIEEFKGILNPFNSIYKL